MLKGISMRAKKLFFVICLPLLFQIAAAKEPGQTSKASQVNDYTLYQAQINIGNFTYWVSNDGRGGYDHHIGAPGGIYPKGTASVIYTDGLFWGGFVDDPDSSKPSLRVNGHAYRPSTTPGRIIAPGIAQDPDDPATRVYRIRRDYLTASDEAMRQDAAALFYQGDVTRVTPGNINLVRRQYQLDWEEWPTEFGAPFYDLNDNGIYEPALGETPGIANADQVAWYACNDVDETITRNAYGSPAIGLEIQGTVWGYEQPNSPLGQAIFKRYRIINKSEFMIDSMFVGHYSDMDIGAYTDDYAGCDTLLNMGYIYNASPFDYNFKRFNIAPSAGGTLLLQGPEKSFAGYLSRLPMTSFNSFRYTLEEPCVNCHEYSQLHYALLNGYQYAYRGELTSFTVGSGPNAGQTTIFPLSGDPFLQTGDIDGLGNNRSPHDQRILVSSGPFTMQPGDTQEIIYALVGGNSIVGNHLTSLQALKTNAVAVKQAFENGFISPTDIRHSITPINPGEIEFAVRMDLTDFTGISTARLHLTDKIGNSDDIPIALYDDGNHNDSLSNDGIWGNRLILETLKYPYQAALNIYTTDSTITYPEFLPQLSFRLSPRLSNWRLIWENGPQDGLFNFRETSFLSFDIENPDARHSIDSLLLRADFTSSGLSGLPVSFISNSGFTQSQPDLRLNMLPSADIRQAEDQYFVITAPHDGDSLRISISINFDNHFTWQEEVFPLQQWYPDDSRGTKLSIEEITGDRTNIEIRIATPANLTGHTYQISFTEDNANNILWHLMDYHTGDIKLSDQPLADETPFPYPHVDGLLFKVFRHKNEFRDFLTIANGNGTFSTPLGASPYSSTGFPGSFPSYNQQSQSDNRWVIHIADEDGENRRYEKFLERISANGANWRRIIGNDFEIRFTTEGSVAGNFMNNGNPLQIPFELWNIGFNTPDDSTDDYRMIPVIKDVDSSGTFNLSGSNHSLTSSDVDPYTDWFYWYDPLDKTPGESGYFAAAEQIMNGAWQTDSLQQVMAGMVLVERIFGGNSATVQDHPETGTIFRLITDKPFRDGDLFRVVAPSALPDSLPLIITDFQVLQNYPNPFNSETIIPYQLPEAAEITIDIYNILGQRVKRLLKGQGEQGQHIIRWDGLNDQGLRVSSGLYFYVLRSRDHLKAKKMILLK